MGAYQVLLKQPKKKVRTGAEAKHYADVSVAAVVTIDTKVCAWCGKAKQKLDREHIVPQWLRRKLVGSYTQLRKRLDLTCYRSCMSCNGRKGPMPGAVFARLPRRGVVFMNDGGEMSVKRGDDWAREYKEWSYIAYYFGQHHMETIPELLIEYVIEAMAEPFDFPPGPQPAIAHNSGQQSAEQRAKNDEYYRRLRERVPQPTIKDVWPSET